MKKNRKFNILVVDDDKPLNVMICKYLAKQGFEDVKDYYSGEELLDEIRKFENPIIIQDYDLPGINGVEILKKVKSINPRAEFIFLSGQSSIEVAVDAVKYGAFDYIIKDNFAKENVITKIRNLIKIKNLTTDKLKFKLYLVIVIAMLSISWLLVITFLLKRM
jgi:FixJ family two-component response regulator